MVDRSLMNILLPPLEPVRCRHLAAAILVNAVNQTEVLLPPRNKTDEQLFEGFEALVWIWSPSSSAYFEAVGKDPEWARVNLNLEFHVENALELAETRRAMLLGFYGAMGRELCRALHSKLPRAMIDRYAEIQLYQSVSLLKSHRFTLEASGSHP